MWARLLRFVKSKDSANIAVNTVGNYLNVFFIAVFALIVVRIMPPVEYGVLSVLLGITYVLANVLDFGIVANIYSTIPIIFYKNKNETYRFLKSNLLYQSLLSIGAILILIIFFPLLDSVFFKTNESNFILYLTAIASIFLVWQNTFLNVFFAAKKFFEANLYLNLANVVKTIVIILFIYYDFINIGSIIFVLTIVGPLFFFLFILISKRSVFHSFITSKFDKKYFKFKYSFPFFIGSQFFNLGLRMDLFMFSFFGMGAAVGFYALAQKIVITIVTTITSITQVVSPNFTGIKTRKQTRLVIKSALAYLSIPVVLYLMLLILPDQLFHFIFTKEYAQSLGITKSLVFPYILFILGQIPFLYILYVARKTSYILYSNIIFFLGMTFGSYFLIPILGVFAPAYIISFSIFFSILIQAIAAYYAYKKLPA